MAAKVLTEAGADVVMLEAGPDVGSGRRTRTCSKWNYDSPRRGAAIPTQQFGEFDAAFGGWTLDGEPYTQRAGQRLRLVPLAHARRPHQSLGPHLAALRPGRLPAQEPRRPRRRLADHLRRPQAVLRRDRQARSGSSAPTSDRASRTSPTASSMPPPKPRCYELLIKQASEKLGIPCVPSRLSILTQAAQRPRRVPLLRPVQPRLRDALELLVAVGAASRRRWRPASCTIIANAMAREVTVDENGLATGVSYIDKNTVARQPRPRAHRRARRQRVRVGAASSSTRSRRSSRRAWRTPAASSAST